MKSPQLVDCRISDDPEHPGAVGGIMLGDAASRDRAGSRLLHQVARQVDVTDDCAREGNESRQ